MSKRERTQTRFCTGRGARARLGMALIAASLAGSFATGSVAADQNPAASAEPGKLEDVLITARKRTENLRDVPASVTAISSDVIQEAHVTQLEDLNALVTNLNMDEAHDNTPDVVLRGVGSYGLVAGVGFYQNDVQLFEGQTARPVDIERIEVLKGPQGTLFGGANVGGAIKYVTKDPTKTWENQASVELGSYSTRNYEAVVSGPLSDQAGIRATVFYDSRDGNIWDTYNKFNYGAVNDHGARIAFVDTPNAENKLHVWLSYENFWTSSQNLMYTVRPPITGGVANLYSQSVDDWFVPQYSRKVASVAVEFEHQINSNVALTSLTSFFTSYNRGYTDFFKKPIPLDYLQQNQDHRVYSEELRLASTGGSNLDWLVGVFFQGHKSESLVIDNNYNGDPNNPQVLPGALGLDYDRDNKMQRRYALFGDATYHVGNWHYEFGLRGEYYTSELSAINTLNTVDPADPTTAVLPIASQRLSGHQLTPKVSVQYTFSPTLNVYASIARGFTPGDLIEETFVIHPYQPEVATNYEVGLKALLDHNIQVNAAVFYTYYKDRLYLFQRLASGNIVDLTSNVGPSTNAGAEFDISAPLPGGFKVSVGMGALSAKWGHTQGFLNPTSPNPPPPAVPSNALDLNGYWVPFSPAYTASVNLEWHHLFSGHEFGARATGSFIGRSYWDPQNYAWQEAYHIINASTWLDVGRFKLIAAVTNLSQTQYNTVYWPGPDVGPPFDIARINRPRMFTVSASVKF